MKRHFKTLIGVSIAVVAIAIIIFLVYSETKQQEQLNEADKLDIKYLSALINKSLDLAESSDERPYLDAMKNAKGVIDTFDQWTGIEKKQKQQAYYLQQDIQSVVDDCNNEHCIYAAEITSLQRANETKIKSLEDTNVQESNQLSSLSSDLLWKNFWHIINDLSVTKLKGIGDEKINGIVDRYWNTAIIDYIKMKQWCDSLGDEYHVFARYKNNCNIDFTKAIKDISLSVPDTDKNFNDPDISSIVSACTFERRLKNIDKTEKSICPHIAEMNHQLGLEADIYLSK